MATIRCEDFRTIGETDPVQISAANLLLAGQQNARPSLAPSSARTSQVSAGSNAETAEFAPLEFARAAEKPVAGRSTAEAARAQTAQPYLRPGSQLDIRV